MTIKLKQYYFPNTRNAVNAINRKILFHNREYLSPELAMFIYNCYIIATRLLIIVDKDIRSREGKTLGDPTGMATYTIIIRSLLDNPQSISTSTKHVGFADDLTVAGKLH